MDLGNDDTQKRRREISLQGTWESGGCVCCPYVSVSGLLDGTPEQTIAHGQWSDAAKKATFSSTGHAVLISGSPAAAADPKSFFSTGRRKKTRHPMKTGCEHRSAKARGVWPQTRRNMHTPAISPAMWN